jgi:ABC-type sugar transport system ATPase subunit/molybdopterin-binding protein
MIRLEGLRVRAGEFSLAIDELAVRPGEYLMVLGPTASGKTVLLETVAGLRRPDAGRIRFGERDVGGDPPERRGVGLVYQDYALFPHLSVAENIGFGLVAGRTPGAAGTETQSHRRAGRRSRQERVRLVATQLGIESLLERHPEGLSGGEQQRVALARALAIQPEVLLLDEPLSALDGPTRTELRAQLGRLHRELGTTIVHVTHDLDEAMALGDRVAVLIAGRLRQVGTPQQVTRAPAETGVARLAGLTNLFPVAEIGARGSQRLIRLKDGLELISEGDVPLGTGAMFAVIPADEIELRPLGGARGAAATWPAQEGRAAQDRGATQDGGVDRRNLLEGSIKAVQIQSVHASVEVELAPILPGQSPLLLAVHVLRPQVERMGLATGLGVGLHIPPRAIHVCSESAEKHDV